MKKLTILIILALAVCSWGVTFTRDHFVAKKWYLYLAADDSGEYYARIDFRTPEFDDSKNFCIGKMMYGKVYPCMQSCVNGDTGVDWTTSGSWNTSSGNAWYYKQTGTQNNYIEIPIPDGYERISFLSYDVGGGNGATLAISWDDGSIDTLDTTSYDSGASTQLAEVVVATDANSNGTKKLRIKHDDASGTARIIGVRAWDLDSDGDPNIAVSGDADAWYGDDFLDTYDTGFQTPTREEVTNGATVIAGDDTAYEFAIKWAPSGDVLKWVGGNNHFAAGNAVYTYKSGSDYDTNGVDVSVDGSHIKYSHNLNRGKLLAGNRIIFVSEGFSDYDEDDTFDSNEPDITWGYNASDNGLGLDIAIDWRATVDVSDSFNYSIMFKPENLSDINKLYSYPSLTECSLSNGVEISGSSAITALYDDCAVTIESGGFPKKFLITSDKLYFRQDVTSFPGGATPDDQIWSIASRYKIRDVGYEEFFEKYIPTRRTRFFAPQLYKQK